jgi:signal transduction histidine kinase
VTKLNSEWARNLNIKIEGLEELKDSKICVLTDEMKLQRVITNLMTNAFQAMPDGGILTISLKACDMWAHLMIKDTGVGIPDEVRDHLFEPYFTTRSQGTGLGLAIAKRIVDESGGSITLEKNGDTGGKGTSVYIRLPLAK